MKKEAIYKEKKSEEGEEEEDAWIIAFTLHEAREGSEGFHHLPFRFLSLSGEMLIH